MPTNLYGINDNYHPMNSHVLPALIRRFFSILFLMQNYAGNDFVNIGTGEDITIRELTEMVALTAGNKAEIRWDAMKPDGTPPGFLNDYDASPLQGELSWKN